MVFDDNVQAIAQEKLLPKAIDTIHNGNVATMRILPNAKTWYGTKLEKPVIVSEAGNGGSFSGLDRFNTNAVNTKQKLSIDVRAFEQPVVIPQLEADVVASSDAAVDFVALAIDEAANEAKDNIGDIFYGDGTGNSNKNFLGFAAIIDDGGEVATYGGLSRTTYTSLKANETDLGGPITLAAMAAMFDSCEVGSDHPTIIYTTPTIWSAFEALHQPYLSANFDARVQVTSRGVNDLKRANYFDAGATGLMYRGVPVVKDEKCTSGTMWFVNENHLAFYRLKSKHPKYTSVSAGSSEVEGVSENENAGFDWSGLMDPIDQYGRVGHMLLLGQLVSFDPRKHGVLNTIS
jgi:hypothetical protein